ncbi:MAG: PaaI family thioesterase, partial [Pseudomonadota bacterium]
MSKHHFARLEAMYRAAPINQKFAADITVSEATARVEMTVGTDSFHAAGAQHGTPYFKALDDACFYAANSMVEDVFMLTSAFNLHLTRPFHEGTMIAEGRLVHGKRRVYLAEATLVDAQGNDLGFASGTFMRSRIPLDTII